MIESNIRNKFTSEDTIAIMWTNVSRLDIYKNNIDLLKKYDIIIHFEPRQKIVDNSFFFLSGNNFYIDKNTIKRKSGTHMPINIFKSEKVTNMKYKLFNCRTGEIWELKYIDESQFTTGSPLNIEAPRVVETINAELPGEAVT